MLPLPPFLSLFCPPEAEAEAVAETETVQQLGLTRLPEMQGRAPSPPQKVLTPLPVVLLSLVAEPLWYLVGQLGQLAQLPMPPLDCSLPLMAHPGACMHLCEPLQLLHARLQQSVLKGAVLEVPAR